MGTLFRIFVQVRGKSGNGRRNGDLYGKMVTVLRASVSNTFSSRPCLCDLALELLENAHDHLAKVLRLAVLFKPCNGASGQFVKVVHLHGGVKGVEETVTDGFENFEFRLI